MKTNESYIAGKLKPEYYEIYAKYFVTFIKKMQYHGIVINAITPAKRTVGMWRIF
jgi:O-glycosyl hydrolase